MKLPEIVENYISGRFTIPEDVIESAVAKVNNLSRPQLQRKGIPMANQPPQQNPQGAGQGQSASNDPKTVMKAHVQQLLQSNPQLQQSAQQSGCVDASGAIDWSKLAGLLRFLADILSNF
jgi:hypothetical protein